MVDKSSRRLDTEERRHRRGARPWGPRTGDARKRRRDRGLDGLEPGEEPRLRGDLLGDHARDAEHGEAADRELLGAEVGLGLEVERIEAQVARVVVLLERPERLRRVLEGLERRVGLEEEDGGDDDGPEGLEGRHLEGDVGRRVDVAAEERVAGCAEEVVEIANE